MIGAHGTVSKQVKALAEMTGRLQQDLQVEVWQWRQRDIELIARVTIVEDLIISKAVDIQKNGDCKLHPLLNLKETELEEHVSHHVDVSKKQMFQAIEKVTDESSTRMSDENHSIMGDDVQSELINSEWLQDRQDEWSSSLDGNSTQCEISKYLWHQMTDQSVEFAKMMNMVNEAWQRQMKEQSNEFDKLVKSFDVQKLEMFNSFEESDDYMRRAMAACCQTVVDQAEEQKKLSKEFTLPTRCQQFLPPTELVALFPEIGSCQSASYCTGICPCPACRGGYVPSNPFPKWRWNTDWVQCDWGFNADLPHLDQLFNYLHIAKMTPQSWHTREASFRKCFFTHTLDAVFTEDIVRMLTHGIRQNAFQFAWHKTSSSNCQLGCKCHKNGFTMVLNFGSPSRYPETRDKVLKFQTVLGYWLNVQLPSKERIAQLSEQ